MEPQLNGLLGELTFTKEDFEVGTSPYEYLYSLRGNPFQHDRELARVTDYAQSVGIKAFKGLYKSYCKSISGSSRNMDSLLDGNFTAFSNQELELNCGTWTADDNGIWRDGANGREYACRHPILIKERLVNIDTGEEAVKLTFRKRYNQRWRDIIVERRTIANARSIVELSAQGVLVTSESARLLVQYLSDLDAFNPDDIPERKSVGRLGYIKGEGFSPYVPGLIFDGDANFRMMFESVSECGRFETWQETVLACRQKSTAAKIMVAASLAAPLVEALGTLPFFVHLWGVDAGTGKTVALMMAASVWGCPEPGKYVKSFNSTSVGLEKTAAFLNHLPLCLDELQLSKDSRGVSRFNVYELAEGIGRNRGTKFGGVERTPTWRTAILTTGESPIVSQNAGAGAVNRVIEIECTSESRVIYDGHTVSETLKSNYGFAGKKLVEKLYGSPEAMERAKSLYQSAYSILLETDTTEKQAMAAAVILTAEWLAFSEGWVFTQGAGTELTPSDLAEFLADKRAVSVGERAYHYLLGWLSQNRFHFDTTTELVAETYGTIDRVNGVAYIIKTVFDKAMEAGGFDQKAVLSYLKHRGKLKLQKSGADRYVVRKRISGVHAQCVALLMENIHEQDEET